MTESQDLARVGNNLNTEDYAALGNSGDAFADALALVSDKLGGAVVDATDLGDGFTVLDKASKRTLIGVPLLILSATFHTGDFKDESGEAGEFVSLRIVTKDGRKVVVNDGGTGIPEQVKMLHKMRPETVGAPILVHNGLRASEYDHPQHGKSVTFYLDTSPAS